MHEELYSVFDDIKKFFAEEESYVKALNTVDYYYCFLETFKMINNNFFVSVTSFNETYEKSDIENVDEFIKFFFEHLSKIKITQHMDLLVFINNSMNTLYIIRKCIEVINLSEAMTLFRKLKDDLLLMIYFLRLSKIDETDYDTINKLEKWNQHVDNAYNWSNSSMKDVYSGTILKFLKKDSKLKRLNKESKIISNLFLLNDQLNDYTHSNSINHISSYNPIYKGERVVNHLIKFSSDMDQVFSYVLTIMIYLAPQYMSTPDYVDYMDMGMTPPANCQYWVSSYFQKLIDEKIAKTDVKLKEFLKENSCMLIE
jgi:hypothetical protein